jgi:hypothetical protein
VVTFQNLVVNGISHKTPQKESEKSDFFYFLLKSLAISIFYEYNIPVYLLMTKQYENLAIYRIAYSNISTASYLLFLARLSVSVYLF